MLFRSASKHFPCRSALRSAKVLFTNAYCTAFMAALAGCGPSLTSQTSCLLTITLFNTLQNVAMSYADQVYVYQKLFPQQVIKDQRYGNSTFIIIYTSCRDTCMLLVASYLTRSCRAHCRVRRQGYLASRLYDTLVCRRTPP